MIELGLHEPRVRRKRKAGWASESLGCVTYFSFYSHHSPSNVRQLIYRTPKKQNSLENTRRESHHDEPFPVNVSQAARKTDIDMDK